MRSIHSILLMVILYALSQSVVASANAMDSDSTIKALTKIAPTSPDYARSLQQLAEIYLSKNTVPSRQKAEWFIRKALSLDPDNFSFNVTFIKILYEKGFYATANETCDRVLTLQPKSGEVYNIAIADVYYYKGLIAERSALKYKDMISFVETTLTSDNYVSLAEFGIEDLKLAASCYELAMQYRSDHHDALFHLAHLYLEVNNFSRMALLFEKAIHLNPADKDAYVFAALAYYRLGQTAQAYQYYQKAFALMTKEEWAVYNTIDYLVPSKESDNFKHNKQHNTVEQYEEKFWKRKDPLYLTAYNERQLEHYNRVAYANLRFGVPKLNLPGWKTERGKAYIRYGKPEGFYSIQPDIGMLGGSQVWQYPQTTFYFNDEYASGNFLMNDSSVLRERSLFNTSSDFFELPKERTFVLQTRLYQFKNPDNLTRIRNYFSAKTDEVDSEYETFGLDVVAVAGLFLFNDRHDIVSETKTRLKLNKDQEYNGQFVHHFELDNLSPNSGVTGYSSELMTLIDNRVGVKREPVKIRDFTADQLMLSDIVMASEISLDNGVTIIPYFGNTISRNRHVYLYFETYHLTLNNESKARYRIETTFIPVNKGNLKSLMKNLFGSNQAQVGSSFDVACNDRDDRYYFALDIKDLDPGEYQLIVRVTDQWSNASAYQSIPVKISTQ